MNKKNLLSNLWVFVTVNYIFCDVFSLFYAPNLNKFLSGNMGGIQLTEDFLLTFAIIMEVAMVMIILSRVLKDKLNRILNISTGILFSIIQVSTLLDGDFTKHYLFFSIVEISTTICITTLALKWNITKID